MATVHGTIGTFDPSLEEWRSYIERLDQYCEANAITTEAKKRAVLLSSCGPTTYALIRSLASPTKPGDIAYADLLVSVGKHYSPAPSSIMQRLKFNSRFREKGESIAIYVAALRKLTEYCDFGDNLNNMLKDRLVCGVNDERIQRRLLSEVDLTFERAFKLAQAAESADKDTRHLKARDAGTSSPGIHYQASKPQAPRKKNLKKQHSTPQTPKQQRYVCWRCGGDHLAPNCRHMDVICKSCQKKGHFANMCRSRPGGDARKPYKQDAGRYKANYVEDRPGENPAEQRQDDPSYAMFTLSSNQPSKPITAEVNLNGLDTSMVVDTGASKSIISESTYSQLTETNSNLRLSKPSVTLTTYTGESLELLGEITVNVRYGSQQLELPLLVTRGSGPDLMGRDWLTHLKLDWQGVYQVESSNDKLTSILEKYPAVFSPGLGSLKGSKVKIHVKDNAQPRFHKARSVPYTLRAKVEEELDNLQKENVISPIQFSELAAPIVAVVKRSGGIRICGDYKLTINQLKHTLYLRWKTFLLG